MKGQRPKERKSSGTRDALRASVWAADVRTPEAWYTSLFAHEREVAAEELERAADALVELKAPPWVRTRLRTIAAARRSGAR